MKLTFLLPILICSAFLSHAQISEDLVRNQIFQLFDAMKKGDTATIKNLFTDSATLETIVHSGNGKDSAKTETLQNFINSIIQQPKGSLDERIVVEIIKTDLDFAMAWVPYKFYYKGVLSHCGVDLFEFISLKGDWKIHRIIDTRRKVGCE